jgi:transposase
MVLPGLQWVIYNIRMGIVYGGFSPMRDIDLFTKLLALERPWTVEEVILGPDDETVNVFLSHRSNARFRCPSCGAFLPLYDHTPLRKWRHLDHGSWMTWLHARLPRVSCSIHGVQRVRVPWALPGSRFSIDFEKHAIDTLLEADTLGASRLLRLSWDETWGVMERAVARGMKAKRRRVISYLGVDEKSIAKRHRYVTLVSDLNRGTVEFIAFDRKKQFGRLLSESHSEAIGGHSSRRHGYVGSVHLLDSGVRSRRRE